MAMDTLGLLFLLNLLAFGLNHEFKVKYEMVDDFGPRAEEWFERSHGIVRRATKQGNSSVPTADPTKSALNTTATTGSNSSLTEPATLTARSSTTSPQKSSITRSPTSNKPTSSINRPSPSLNKPTSGISRPNTTNNISIIEDNHRYYKSQYYDAGEQWWFDLELDGGNAKIHAGLSKNLQYSDTIDTSFKFPYYGHLIDKVTITNKGFVFLGERLHKFNASMQYVAPLMANFGPHLYENTTIRYVDTGDRFTTEWANIRLLKNQTAAGEFSFQCSIFKNGTIVFAYKKIPIPVSEIKNTFFVRVGLSDSYVLHHDRFFVINGKVYGIRFVVYYRYHQVKLPWSNVKSGSAFVITPLLNCVFYKTCNSCIQSKTAFSCEWCPKLNRCSDGFDRHRQEWLLNRCYKNSKTTCSAVKTTPKFVPTSKVNIVISKSTKSEGGKEANKHHESSIDGSGIAILVVLCVGIVLALICWYVYAYRHPQSTSGMFLIKYGNPTKWCRNSNGETTSSTGGNVSFKSMSDERTA